MYYHNGQIHKIWKARKIVVYYPNGNVKEKMKLNKHGYIYDYWFKYDEAGNIVEKKYYENDNAEDGSYYFYYP